MTVIHHKDQTTNEHLYYIEKGNPDLIIRLDKNTNIWHITIDVKTLHLTEYEMRFILDTLELS